MAKESTKNEDVAKSTQETNFDNARETARINHEANTAENANNVSGYEGVEVREARNIEVINPVRNQVTGELEDDTRTVKLSDEEVVGAKSPETTDKA